MSESTAAVRAVDAENTTLTVMDRLRNETREDHDATEAIPFSAAMVNRVLPRERFVAHLAAYAIVHDAIETALASADHRTVRAVWRDDLRKLPLLERDLAFFAADRAAASEHPAVRVADTYAVELRELGQRDPVALLGHLYVLEGSTLGGTILRGHIKEAYNLDQDGLAYYSPYGNAVMPHWREFKLRMNDAITDPAEQDRVVAAGREAFRHIGTILHALSDGLSAETSKRPNV
jgi:heme oxygenase